MSQFPREPLDADERAIAAQLPRLHGRTAPDAAMDARILAAAHAAAQAGPTGTPRRHGRWVVPLGLAASLCVALGLAWRLQLEPPPGAPPARAIADAAPVAPRPATSPPASPPPTAPALPPAMPAPVTAKRAITAEQSAPAIPAADASRANAGVLAEMAQPAAPPAAPAPPVAEAPAATMAPPPPPPAPMAAPALQAMAEPPPMPRATAARAPEALRRMAPPPPAEDAPVEDVPPATVDAPAVREAWLRRIGELARQGQREAARASLEEFRRRYPDATVPPELNELLPPAPSKPGE